MVGPSDMSKLVPGFDFLQGLMKSAGAGLPNMGQWIAPTLDPEEIGKRIQELKTVQFWLEQNARLLATTIQALEVQRMTLSTLQTMNLPLAQIRDSLKANPLMAASAAASAAASPLAVPAAAAKAAAPAAQDAAASGTPRKAKGATGPATAGKTAAAAPAKTAIDPMQWWGALTQQFAELAGNAMREGSAEMARSLAGSVAKKAVSGAMGAPAKAVGAAAQAVASMAGSSAAKPRAPRQR